MVRFWQISLVIGVLTILCAITVLVIGVDYLWGSGLAENTDEENKDAGISMMICGPVVLITGLVFFIIGIIGLLRRKRNREYAELLKAHRRIALAEFARKIGTNEFKAEKIIVGILEDNQIKGFMDRRTGEFFTKEYLEQTPDVLFGWKCSSCGAKNDSIVLPGETGQCAYCGNVMGAKVEKMEGGIPEGAN